MNKQPSALACEAVEGYFAFGPQPCQQAASAVVTCEDVTCSTRPHEHAVCPDHGGGPYEKGSSGE